MNRYNIVYKYLGILYTVFKYVGVLIAVFVLSKEG